MENSTQLTQIALDDVIREIAIHADVSLSALQQSLNNNKSPIRALYQAMLNENKAERQCLEKLAIFQAHKKAIGERLRKVQKLLFSNNDPSLETTFRRELTESGQLEKELSELIDKCERIVEKCQQLRITRVKQVKKLLQLFDQSKEELQQLFSNHQFTDYNDQQLNAEIADLLYLTRGAKQ